MDTEFYELAIAFKLCRRKIFISILNLFFIVYNLLFLRARERLAFFFAGPDLIAFAKICFLQSSPL